MIEESASVGRKLLSGSVLRVGHLVAAGIASFFLMPFIVRHLGDRAYGFWSLIATLIGYYDLLDLGMSSAASQYLSIAIGRGDRTECRAVFNAGLRIKSLFGGIALLATGAIATAAPWLCHDPNDAHLFSKVIVILGISASLGFPAKVYGGVLAAEFRFDIQSWLAILQLAFRTGLVVWVMLAGGGLLGLAWATLFAMLPITVLQIWFARREASWCRIECRPMGLKRLKNLFSYSIHTFLAYLADILRFQVDTVVVSGFIGLVAVTHYRVAGILAQYYLQTLIVSIGMLQPVLSRFYGAANRAGLERLFFFGTKLSCCISVFVCLALIAWGKPFIARWMGVLYADAYRPLIVLSIAIFLDVSQKPSIDLLYATFKHRVYTYMNWAEGLLNLTCSLVLARPLGILGVATGTLIGAFVIRVVVQPWLVCRVTELQYGSYIRFVGTNILCCATLMFAAIITVSWGLQPNYVSLISSAACATSIYAITSWWLVLDQSERKRFTAAILHFSVNPMEFTPTVPTS